MNVSYHWGGTDGAFRHDLDKSCLGLCHIARRIHDIEQNAVRAQHCSVKREIPRGHDLCGQDDRVVHIVCRNGASVYIDRALRDL